MFAAAAICPCPPLLVPEVAAGAAAELDALREACAAALTALRDADPDLVWVVGPDDGPHDGGGGNGAGAPREYAGGSTGSFAPFGVPREVRLGDGPGAGPLPAPLAVGAWLLEPPALPPAVPVRGLAVPQALPAARCAEAGARLAVSAARVGLLVVGDGSARRSVTAPGYLDARAEPFDAQVAAALGEPDGAARLAALDERLAADLLACGRAPWQVLAGAAAGASFRPVVHYADAPYGVGYFAAAWA